MKILFTLTNQMKTMKAISGLSDLNALIEEKQSGKIEKDEYDNPTFPFISRASGETTFTIHTQSSFLNGFDE